MCVSKSLREALGILRWGCYPTNATTTTNDGYIKHKVIALVSEIVAFQTPQASTIDRDPFSLKVEAGCG